MQKEVTRKQKLLNSDGIITEPGWARQLVWQYNKEQMKAPWFRKKEWDYYLIYNEQFGVAFTIADLGFAGLISASFLDFVHKEEYTETVIEPFPMGKRYGLGRDSKDGFAKAKTSRVELSYETEWNEEAGITVGKRKIICKFNDFYNKKKLTARIIMKQPPMDTMCIATPFEKKKTAFYYNQKINCMPAEGSVLFDGKAYQFSNEDSFGILDWGRGVWTYDNTWYWGTGNMLLNGKPFGFNLGYGFSDRSTASENLLFYDNKAHKLEDVEFIISKDANGKQYFMKEWKISSNNKRLEGKFVPILDRAANIDFKLIVSNQHQIFGFFTGTAQLDDGTKLEIKKFLCAIEVVHNRY